MIKAIAVASLSSLEQKHGFALPKTCIFSSSPLIKSIGGSYAKKKGFGLRQDSAFFFCGRSEIEMIYLIVYQIFTGYSEQKRPGKEHKNIDEKRAALTISAALFTLLN